MVFATTQSTATSLNLFRRLAEHGFKGTRIGFLDVDPTMLRGFGALLNGVLLPGYLTASYSNEFTDAYTKKHGAAPDMYAAIAHDMFLNVVAVVKNGAVKTNMVDRLSAESVEGLAVRGFRFNTDRTVTIPLGVLRIDGERLEPVDFTP